MRIITHFRAGAVAGTPCALVLASCGKARHQRSWGGAKVSEHGASGRNDQAAGRNGFLPAVRDLPRCGNSTLLFGMGSGFQSGNSAMLPGQRQARGNPLSRKAVMGIGNRMKPL